MERGKSSWRVFQQLGADSSENVPEIVREAFENQEINLSPHGAVALLRDGDAAHTTSCYLPLSVTSGLPFSIHGHFALNTARRDLWKGQGDFKACWNEWLTEEVLAPVVTRALCSWRSSIFPDDATTISTSDYNTLIKKYYAVLPNCNDAEADAWKILVKHVYMYVEKKKVPLFEVCVREKKPKKTEGSVTLRWCPMKGQDDANHLYFCSGNDSEASNEKVEAILKRLQMSIGTPEAYKLLVNADMKPLTLDSATVIKYLQHFRREFSDLFDSEHRVEDTPFNCVEDVGMVFEYVAENDNLHQHLHGFPLLVTSDRVLRTFNKHKPVFLTKYCNLLPTSKYGFVCDRLVNEIESWIEKERNKHVKRNEKRNEIDVKNKGQSTTDIKIGGSSIKELKRFTLAEFVDRLPASKLMLHDGRVVPVVNDEAQQNSSPYTVSLTWLKSVWDFIISEIEFNHVTIEIANNQETRKTDWTSGRKKLLNLFNKWSLNPVTKGKKPYVMAVDAKLALPKKSSPFDLLPLTRPMTLSNNPQHKCYHLQHLSLFATFDDHSSVLDCLLFHTEEIREELETWKEEKSAKLQKVSSILEYFGEIVFRSKMGKLSPDKLRALPLYEDVFGKIHDLTRKTIIVLDSLECPLEGLQHLAAISNTVLLPPYTSRKLSCLYQYMDKNCIMHDPLSIQIYVRFILPQFQHLDEEYYTKHMEFLLKSLCSVNLDIVGKSSTAYLAVVLLRKTPFIKTADGHKPLNAFYDPQNVMFQLIKPDELLPTEWQQHDAWAKVFKIAGLVHNITWEMFLEMAGGLSEYDPLIHEKSSALVEYLFLYIDEMETMSDVERTKLMTDIQKLRFIIPMRTDDLNEILPFYRADKGLVSFREAVPEKYKWVVWSKCAILPQYANPAKTNVQLSDKFKSLNEAKMYKKFGIPEDVETETVVEHLQNLCRVARTRRFPNRGFLMKMMEEIYTYLESHEILLNGDFLRNVPIVYLPEKNVFTTPDSIVMKLETEIQPYLYCGPVSFGHYFPIFEKLGAYNHPTAELYIKVLQKIKQESSGMEMTLKQKEAAHLAMKGLVHVRESLKRISDSPSPYVYFPTRNGTLRKSSKVYIPDNAMFERDIEGFDSIPLLVQFAEFRFDITEVVFLQYLPETLRPKFLSEIMQYELGSSGLQEDPSQFSVALQSFISSRKFHCAVLRLVQHNYVMNQKIISLDKLLQVSKSLANMEVKQIKKVEVKFTIENSLLVRAGECSERSWYIQKITHKNQEVTTVYFDRRCVKEYLIAKLNEVYQEFFIDNRCATCLAMLLSLHDTSCSLDNYLDQFRIKAFYCRLPWPKESDIGKVVDSKLKELINYKLQVVRSDELVAMKKNISSEEDEFVIVKVLECLEKPIDRYEALYKVDDGARTQQAKGYQLYRTIDHHEELEDEDLNIEMSIHREIINLRLVKDQVVINHLHCRLLKLKNTLSHSEHPLLTERRKPWRDMAEMWMKQARHDFQSAQEELESRGSNCWIMYKCQQVSYLSL